MKEYPIYLKEDKMVSLIKDDYRLIQVLSRFGIPMGFGDKTIKEACEDNKVDCNTFLAVVNFITNENFVYENLEILSLESLLHYLKQSHIYFLEFCLPAIRRKLLDGITLRESDVSFLIIKLYDEYVDEISLHMEQEEKTFFNYITSLIEGKTKPELEIATYSDHHDRVGYKLRELKNIIIKYCPSDAKTNLLNAALYDIYRCEEELLSHCHIEDYLLLPALRKLEKKFQNSENKK